MKKYLASLIATGVLASLAYAGTQKQWDGTYSPYSIRYLMYSNNLDEAAPPKGNDRRMSVLVEGRLAQEIFDSIGPDVKGGCGASQGLRLRQKGDVECSYDKDDSKSPYACYFGLDLRTGRSIAGSTC